MNAFSKFTWDVYQPWRDGVVHVADGALAAIFNIMRDLCGPDWKPTEVWFAHPPPADAGPFQRYFPAPLRFDAERNAVVFATAWLRRPVLQADQGSDGRYRSRSTRWRHGMTASSRRRCEVC